MKVALITGGNRGIGRSTALEVTQRGVGVILTYNSHAEEGAAVVEEIKSKGGRAVALQLDVTKTKNFADFAGQVEKVLQKEWNRKTFDYLVNNAGFAQRTLIKDTSEEQFDQLMLVHYKGPFFLTQKLLPLIEDGGHIINISTGLTRFAHPGVATYAALKGALEIFTRYLAQECGPRKIRANVVAPGAIDTQFGGGKTDPEILKMIASNTALGRVGHAEDVAVAIAALLSEDSRWINAQRIEVAGGTAI